MVGKLPIDVTELDVFQISRETPIDKHVIELLFPLTENI